MSVSVSMTSNTHYYSVGLASLVTGILIGKYLASGAPQTRLKKRRPSAAVTPSATSSTSTSTSATTSSEGDEDEYTTEEDDEEDEDEGIDVNSTPLNEIPGEVRMTLIVRQDLKMGKGKAAAQCSHATLALYKKITNPASEAFNPEMVQRWEYGNGQAKITLQVPNQEEMDILFAQAISLGVNSYIVHDAGRTQIAAGSATVLGLGPAPKAVLDQITGSLKLY